MSYACEMERKKDGEVKRTFLIETAIYVDIRTGKKETQYKLYIYENDIDTYDYLFPILEDTFSYAEEKFELSRGVWVQTE